MGKYLKMSDTFNGDVEPKQLSGWKHQSRYVELKAIQVAAAHAINSHDELVEIMQHYKKEAEQWEARATNEASRVQDLVVEVERLLARVADLEWFTYHFCDNSYNVDLGGGDCTATTCEAKEMAHKLDNRVWPDLWPGH